MGGITLGTGIFSGIDTRSLIEQLIAIESRPKQLAQRRLLNLQGQQAALLDFRNHAPLHHLAGGAPFGPDHDHHGAARLDRLAMGVGITVAWGRGKAELQHGGDGETGQNGLLSSRVWWGLDIRGVRCSTSGESPQARMVLSSLFGMTERARGDASAITNK